MRRPYIYGISNYNPTNFLNVLTLYYFDKIYNPYITGVFTVA